MDNLCSNVGGGVACWVKNEHDFEVLENSEKAVEGSSFIITWVQSLSNSFSLN